MLLMHVAACCPSSHWRWAMGVARGVASVCMDDGYSLHDVEVEIHYTQAMYLTILTGCHKIVCTLCYCS